MGRLLGKKWVLGSCCVAALLTTAGCQTGSNSRSPQPLAKSGMTPGAFTSKDALAAQKRSGSQPIGGSPSPLLGGNPGQFPGPAGMQPTGGQNMGGLPPLGNSSGLSSSGTSPGAFGGTPPSGLTPTGFPPPLSPTGALPTTGALPPPGTDLPRNPTLSPSPGGTTGTMSRDTIPPPPGAFDTPTPVPATPNYNSFPSR